MVERFQTLLDHVWCNIGRVCRVVLMRSIVLVTVGDQRFSFNRGHMALIRCELLRGIGRWPRLLIGRQTRLVTPFSAQ
jgi:hypothetical protein